MKHVATTTHRLQRRAKQQSNLLIRARAQDTVVLRFPEVSVWVVGRNALPYPMWPLLSSAIIRNCPVAFTVVFPVQTPLEKFPLLEGEMLAGRT